MGPNLCCTLAIIPSPAAAVFNREEREREREGEINGRRDGHYGMKKEGIKEERDRNCVHMYTVHVFVSRDSSCHMVCTVHARNGYAMWT